MTKEKTSVGTLAGGLQAIPCRGRKTLWKLALKLQVADIL